MREGKIISVCERENRHTHTQSVRETDTRSRQHARTKRNIHTCRGTYHQEGRTLSSRRLFQKRMQGRGWWRWRRRYSSSSHGPRLPGVQRAPPCTHKPRFLFATHLKHTTGRVQQVQTNRLRHGRANKAPCLCSFLLYSVCTDRRDSRRIPVHGRLHTVELENKKADDIFLHRLEQQSESTLRTGQQFSWQTIHFSNLSSCLSCDFRVDRNTHTNKCRSVIPSFQTGSFFSPVTRQLSQHTQHGRWQH